MIVHSRRVDADGMNVLSRRVVCVELDGKLKVYVMARCGDEKEDVGSSEMEVTVAWSVFSDKMFARGDSDGYSTSSSHPASATNILI
jgi:hypothetical protein